MKIYFEDGILLPTWKVSFKNENRVWRLNAALGVSRCIAELQERSKRDDIVYTNTIFALDSKYTWNEDEDAPEIYIRDMNGDFCRIDKLTTRKLTKSTNIAKLYLAREFDYSKGVNKYGILQSH